MNCWKCGAEYKQLPGERVKNRDTCAQCDADLHVCRNCRHYDPTAHNECRETQAEWVRFKEKNNYCDYFSGLSIVPLNSRPKAAPETDARKKFDKLFNL